MFSRQLPTIVVLIAITAATWANMGTAVMIAAMMHFAFLNPIIALLEAALLMRWAQMPFSRALAAMLTANYLSYFAGLLFGSPLSLELGKASHTLLESEIAFFHSLPYLLGLLTVVLFLLTVLIELPVVYLAGKCRWPSALRNTVKVNILSYLLLVFFYLSSSDFGFIRSQFESDLRFVQTQPTTVYYIAPDGMLTAISLTGGAPRLLGKRVVEDMRTLQLVYAFRGMHLERDKTTAQWWLTFRNQRLLPIATNPPDSANAEIIHTLDWRQGEIRWRITEIPDKPAVVHDKENRYSIGLVMPFHFDPCQSLGVFTMRNVSYLPGDYAVFELGGRIWVLHMPTRRVGLLARGYMPVAIMGGRREQSASSGIL